MNPHFSRLRRSAPRLITVIGVLAICLGSSSKSCRLITDNIENRDDLSFAVALTTQDQGGQITDSFEDGESIQLVMTVRNELDTAATIEFSTSRQTDFIVVRSGTSDKVWQWSDDQTFTQARSELTFEAGETKTFTVLWNQLSAAGVQVRSGTYQARGVLHFSGFDADPLQDNEQASELVTFRILD
jgi:hypothetical protein